MEGTGESGVDIGGDGVPWTALRCRVIIVIGATDFLRDLVVTVSIVLSSVNG